MKMHKNLNTTNDFPISKFFKHQFKPGQSGNPSERPKDSFNFKTQISRIASGTAVLSSEFGTIPLSHRNITVFKVVNDAMHNNLVNLQKLLPNLDIKTKGDDND